MNRREIEIEIEAIEGDRRPECLAEAECECSICVRYCELFAMLEDAPSVFYCGGCSCPGSPVPGPHAEACAVPKIGSRIWRSRGDHRVYAPPKKPSSSSGSFVMRGNYQQLWIIGEASRSWIVARDPEAKIDNKLATSKISKAALRRGEAGFLHAAELDAHLRGGRERQRVKKRIEELLDRDPKRLREFATLVGIELPEGEARPDGGAYIVDSGSYVLTDDRGRIVGEDGRPALLEMLIRACFRQYGRSSLPAPNCVDVIDRDQVEQVKALHEAGLVIWTKRESYRYRDTRPVIQAEVSSELLALAVERGLEAALAEAQTRAGGVSIR